MRSGGKAKIWLIGLTEEVTIHHVGKTKGTASTQSRP
jgi:hypothetical protein